VTVFHPGGCLRRLMEAAIDSPSFIVSLAHAMVNDVITNNRSAVEQLYGSFSCRIFSG
jgi:hypothetical protein